MKQCDEDRGDGFDDAFGDDFSEEFDQKNSHVNAFDPLSGYNRVITSFNDKLYFVAIKPLTTGYSAIVPEGMRIGIANFFDNILFPVRFVNNLLQLKIQYATEELARFTVNSTLGIGGLLDPAKNDFGLMPHKEDFGQTLGYYGVGSGFHVVLPFLGPSNVRDIAGLSIDSFADPQYFLNTEYYKVAAIKSYRAINETSLNIGKYEDIKKSAIDLYPFIRDAYEQNRNTLIKE
jgi:phospholipid-binding lipoprotein MlaA